MASGKDWPSLPVKEEKLDPENRSIECDGPLNPSHLNNCQTEGKENESNVDFDDFYDTSSLKEASTALIFCYANPVVKTPDKTEKNKTERSRRAGTHKDCKSLKDVLKCLNFSPWLYHDLTMDETIDIIKTASKDDHTQRGAFVCVFLSHGNESGEIGTDDGLLKWKPLMELFNPEKCSSLAGKPKICIIQVIHF